MHVDEMPVASSQPRRLGLCCCSTCLTNFAHAAERTAVHVIKLSRTAESLADTVERSLERNAHVHHALVPIGRSPARQLVRLIAVLARVSWYLTNELDPGRLLRFESSPCPATGGILRKPMRSSSVSSA